MAPSFNSHNQVPNRLDRQKKKVLLKSPNGSLWYQKVTVNVPQQSFSETPTAAASQVTKKLSIILHESKGILIILLTVQGKGVLIKQGEDTSIASGHINDDTLTCND